MIHQSKQERSQSSGRIKVTVLDLKSAISSPRPILFLGASHHVQPTLEQRGLQKGMSTRSWTVIRNHLEASCHGGSTLGLVFASVFPHLRSLLVSSRVRGERMVGDMWPVGSPHSPHSPHSRSGRVSSPGCFPSVLTPARLEVHLKSGRNSSATLKNCLHSLCTTLHSCLEGRHCVSHLLL